MLQTAKIFQDGMILQRGKRICVWGKSEPETTVTVEIQGQKESTIAKENGEWSVFGGSSRKAVAGGVGRIVAVMVGAASVTAVKLWRRKGVTSLVACATASPQGEARGGGGKQLLRKKAFPSRGRWHGGSRDG